MEEFPLEIRDVDPELNQQLLQDFDGERTGWVQVGPEGYLYPSSYKIHGPRLYNFKVRPDDTWIVTFPRSGTTLSQEMIWLIANKMDFETASNVNLLKRFPFIEFCLFMNDKFMDEYRARYSSEPEKLAMIDNLCTPTYEVLDVTPSPRFIKTHLPFSLLPPNLLESGAKVIYVARNPMDVAVSFYHLNRLLRIIGFQNDFHRHWDNFQRNLIPWAPFWSHVTEAWGLRQNPNLLFLFYEDIIKNIPSTIRGVAQFLNKTVTEEQVTQLAAHLHIDTFRNNPSIDIPGLQELDMIRPGEQGFIRKGKSGGWSEEFTPDLQEKAYQWIQENLQKTDIRFPLFNSKFE